MLAEAKKYAIGYYNDDIGILKPAKIRKGKLNIELDKQKVIDIKDAEMVGFDGDIKVCR